MNLPANFQPDIIEVDMELERAVDTSRARQANAHRIPTRCNELGLTVLIQVTETAVERDVFVFEGVVSMQGYLDSRPAFESLDQIDPQAWPSV